MKKLLKIACGLLALLALFLGIVIGINRWPRPVEAPLWTEKDLASPEKEIPGENVYPELVKLKDIDNQDQPLISKAVDAANEAAPAEIYANPDLIFASGRGDAEIFWNKAKSLAATLSAFQSSQSKALELVQRIFAYPQLIDLDDPKILGQNKASWVDLLELHRLANLEIAALVVSDRQTEAYDLWLKMFRQDLSHLRSARGLISLSVAITKMSDALDTLARLRSYPPDAATQQKIRASLGQLDPGSINCHRAMINEYLINIGAMDLIAAKKDTGIWQSLTFNPAPIMKELNARFWRIDAYAANPSTITPEVTKQFIDQVRRESYRGLFYWVYNPTGKTLLKLLALDPFAYIQQVSFNAGKLDAMKSQLLAFPEFPASAQALPVEPEDHFRHDYSGPTANPVWKYLDSILDLTWTEAGAVCGFLAFVIGLIIWPLIVIRRARRARRLGEMQTLWLPLLLGIVAWLLAAGFIAVDLIFWNYKTDYDIDFIVMRVLPWTCIMIGLIAIRTGQKRSQSHISIFRITALLTLLLAASGIYAKYQADQLSSFYRAARGGKTEIMQQYLDKGYSPNFKFKGSGKPLLFLAVDSRKTDAVGLLLKAGADINALDRSGHSALYFAVVNDDSGMVKFLLEQGANPHAEKDYSFLVELAKSRSPEVREQIVAGEAKP